MLLTFWHVSEKFLDYRHPTRESPKLIEMSERLNAINNSLKASLTYANHRCSFYLRTHTLSRTNNKLDRKWDSLSFLRSKNKKQNRSIFKIALSFWQMLPSHISLWFKAGIIADANQHRIDARNRKKRMKSNKVSSVIFINKLVNWEKCEFEMTWRGNRMKRSPQAGVLREWKKRQCRFGKQQKR